MSESDVENLDDEELLVYYKNTKKLLESRVKDENSANGKIGMLQQKVLDIEEELKARSLWEVE
jgi:hypothetical protein